MALSPYLEKIRSHVGKEQLLLPSVSVAIFNDANEILMMKHIETEKWCIPGGAIECGEEPKEAAIREVMEETSLEISITNLVGVYGGKENSIIYRNGDKVSYINTIYKAKVISGILKPDPTEIIDIGFYSIEEAQKLDIADWVKTAWDDLSIQKAP